MLKPFEHYALQNPPSIYDEESGTALKMCARLAGKVNEAIKAFNELAQATSEDIAEQNAHIQEVLDNLGTAIQNTMEIIVANGTFDEMIDEYSHAEMVEIERTLSKRIDYANIARDLITTDWVGGTISETGILTASTNRIMSGRIQAPTKGPLYLGVAEAYQVRVYEYETPTTFHRASEWIIGESGVVVPYEVNAPFVRLVVGKVDGTPVELSEANMCTFTKDVYPFKDVQDDVTRLKGILASLGVARTTPADQGTRVNLASTRRFFLETPIPAKVHIKEIRVKSVAGGNKVRVQLWAPVKPLMHDDLFVELVHTIEKTSVMSEVNGQSFPVNMVFDHPVYVSVWSENNCVVGYTGTGHNLLVTPDIAPESTEIDLSTAETFTGYHAGVVVHYDEFTVVRKTEKVLYVGEGYEFTEIQDAIDYAREQNISPCVIRVAPGTYKRFSMIRALHDPYPWTGAPVPSMSIIGESRELCVIEDGSGDYNTPPAELLCNGSIENLSFVSESINLDTSTADKGSYAAHIDAEPADNTKGYKMAIRNCYFYSDTGPAVGVGLHNKGHVTFENCTFESNITQEAVTDSSGEILWAPITEHGVVYVHASVAEGEDEMVRTVNCTFHHGTLHTTNLSKTPLLIDGSGYGDITGSITAWLHSVFMLNIVSGPSQTPIAYTHGTVSVRTSDGTVSYKTA